MTCPASFAGLVRWLVVISVVPPVPRVARCIEGANGKHSPRTDLFSASLGLKYSIQNRFIRERGTGIHLAPLCSVAGQSRVVEVGVTLDAIARDATALLDVAEQLHQRRQLHVGK